MKPGKRAEKGQISIMIAIMMSTFILLIAFVINTGMLVNAKINLQNAADMAAYAGAATQARQLTHISYINYEMRRQWKKLLFRIYVIGNMSQDEFPKTSGKSGPMRYIPNKTDPLNSADYGLPVTCVAFNPKTDNPCRNTKLPKISIPPSSILDSVTETLRGQLMAIESIRQENCKSIGQANKMLNIYWLFNTDPDLADLENNPGGLSQNQADVLRILRVLSTGLGIVPRETILWARINTLSSYVNAKPQKDLGFSAVQGLSSSPDPLLYERSIQAYLSAYYTLGNHTFPADSIVLDELLPAGSGGDSALLLKLNDIRTNFDTYAIDWDLTGGGDCKAQIIPVAVRNPVPVGVSKESTIMTYYAVRLKAKAKILFSPFGDLDLKAYSAAQPFGSRIGPGDGAFTTEAEDRGNANFKIGLSTLNPTNKIPNLPVKEGDSSEKGSGWDTYEVLGEMYSQFAKESGGSVAGINRDILERVYTAAMTPSPWEAKKYNIINDLDDGFTKNFDPRHEARIWAPIFPPGKSAAQIQSEITAIIDGTQTTGNLGLGLTSDAALTKVKEALKVGLTRYITTSLSTGKGEKGESSNIIKIEDPFGGRLVSRGLPNVYLEPEIEKVKTSWNQVNDSTFRSKGRVGYSVKFVSFDSLTASKMKTDGIKTWTNQFSDSEASEDILNYIQH